MPEFSAVTCSGSSDSRSVGASARPATNAPSVRSMPRAVTRRMPISSTDRSRLPKTFSIDRFKPEPPDGTVPAAQRMDRAVDFVVETDAQSDRPETGRCRPVASIRPRATKSAMSSAQHSITAPSTRSFNAIQQANARGPPATATPAVKTRR